MTTCKSQVEKGPTPNPYDVYLLLPDVLGGANLVVAFDLLSSNFPNFPFSAMNVTNTIPIKQES